MMTMSDPHPHEPDWVGCPDADVCRRCPRADDDDVCFPGERLRAENERLRERLALMQGLVSACAVKIGDLGEPDKVMKIETRAAEIADV